MDSAGWKGGAVEAGQSFKKPRTTGPNMGAVLAADDPTGMGLDGLFQPTSGTLSGCDAESNLELGNDSGNTDGRPGSSSDVPIFHLPANVVLLQFVIFRVTMVVMKEVKVTLEGALTTVLEKRPMAGPNWNNFASGF